MSHGFQSHSNLPALPMGNASNTRSPSPKVIEMLPSVPVRPRPNTPMPTAHARPAHDQTVVRTIVDIQSFGKLLSIISAITADEPLTSAEKCEMLEYLQEIADSFKPQIGISVHQKSITLIADGVMTMSSITSVIAHMKTIIQELKTDVILNAAVQLPAETSEES